MVALNHRGRGPSDRHALNDIGVQGPLSEVTIPMLFRIERFQFERSRFEDPDKFFPNNLAFFFRVCDARQTLKEAITGIDILKLDAKRFAENFLDGFGLARA